jgi:hypothetical protein
MFNSSRHSCSSFGSCSWWRCSCWWCSALFWALLLQLMQAESCAWRCRLTRNNCTADLLLLLLLQLVLLVLVLVLLLQSSHLFHNKPDCRSDGPELAAW